VWAQVRAREADFCQDDRDRPGSRRARRALVRLAGGVRSSGSMAACLLPQGQLLGEARRLDGSPEVPARHGRRRPRGESWNGPLQLHERCSGQRLEWEVAPVADLAEEGPSRMAGVPSSKRADTVAALMLSSGSLKVKPSPPAGSKGARHRRHASAARAAGEGRHAGPKGAGAGHRPRSEVAPPSKSTAEPSLEVQAWNTRGTWMATVRARTGCGAAAELERRLSSWVEGTMPQRLLLRVRNSTAAPGAAGTDTAPFSERRREERLQGSAVLAVQARRAARAGAGSAAARLAAAASRPRLFAVDELGGTLRLRRGDDGQRYNESTMASVQSDLHPEPPDLHRRSSASKASKINWADLMKI